MQNHQLPPLREASEAFDFQSRMRLQIPGESSLSGNAYPPQGTYPPGLRMPPFYAASDMSSVSPSEAHTLLVDPYRSPGSATMPPQPGQLAAMMMHNPKRPYRQRRKDPSCDACRERKVKCDATETTSCTECSSRNVRCQFTKDTNRRMSSIKQVQDLERQLLDARQQLDRFRTAETRSEASSAVSQSPTEALAELPALGRSPRRMLKARTPSDLASARSHLMNFGRGLVKPPVTPSPSRASDTLKLFQQQLPPRNIADHLVQAYLECVHRRFPVIYWPEFHQKYLALYETDPNRATSREFYALLFSIFACGALHTDDPEIEANGPKLLSQATSMVNLWDDDVTAGQAVVGFLISIFLFETNRKSAAWIWLGACIRIAQDKGYHVQGGQWTTVEGEMRKRVWWSFYVWDRILAFELGKPMIIDDDDCDTEHPDSLEEETSRSEDNPNPLQPTLLLAAIHVARLLYPLAKLCRALCITNSTLTKFEAHLHSCLYLLPRQLHLSSTNPIDPLIMAPVLYFQNTRLMLHRHNMSPSCSAEQRLQSIGQCIYAAQDTASLVSRVMMLGSKTAWETRLAVSTTTLLCTHLWRCMLFLVFRQLYEPFFVLTRAASVIGNRRIINICCGRYLLFFIERLMTRYEEGKVADLEQDEEMIVYLSADLQAGTNSWVWGNTETGTLLSRRQKHGRPRHASQEMEQDSPAEGLLTWDTTLSPDEVQNWGGWQRVEQAATHLRQLQEKAEYRTELQGGLQSPSSPNETSKMAMPTSSSGASPTDNSRSRMNIASII